MADYGNKDSTKRGEWYDTVISPLKNAGKLTGGNWTSLPNRAQWMAEKRGGLPNSKLHHTKWPKKMSNLAKTIATAIGSTWSAGKFSTTSKAATFAEELYLGAQVYGIETAPADDTASDPLAEESTSEDMFLVDEDYPAGGGYALTDGGGYGTTPAPGMPTWAVVLLSLSGIGALVGGGLLIAKAMRD